MQARHNQVWLLHQQGRDPKQICAELGITKPTVYSDLKILGIELPSKRPRTGLKLIEKRKEASAARQREVVRDRRRFKGTPVPTGMGLKKAPKSSTGTMFQKQVKIPGPDDRVLKDGCNNSKIGGDVLVGWLKGAKIFTLTLEERATCPKDCDLWQACYGNNMQHSARWVAGPALEAKLRQEIKDLCAEHRQVLIRLHILGDFYSKQYLALWAELLDTHRNLHVFGFTAWKPGTDLGDLIALMRHEEPRRFAVRTSGTTGAWGSFTIDFPTERRMLGDAVVCPEQRDAMNGEMTLRHCGSCGLCWKTNHAIVFVEH